MQPHSFDEEPIYTQLARVGKALASPVRLRLLDLLEEGETTVEVLAHKAGFGVKNTSAQLQHLKTARLVTSRKAGTSMHYRLADDRVSGFLGAFQEFAEDRLSQLRHEIVEYLGRPDELRPITAAALSSVLDDPTTVVVDVRAADEFDVAHVPGAINVPVEHLEELLDRLPSDAEIVAYCQGPYCVVSPTAVRTLHGHGYRARILDGGYTRWRRTHGRHHPLQG